MSEIWNKLITIQDNFISEFDRTGTEVVETDMIQFNQPGWVNRVWQSDTYRRAHVDVVDARSTKGLWMMHCCIFPHVHNTAPIFGFDIIAGRNKITGCFYDFSPVTTEPHALTSWFSEEVADIEWNKVRKLPEWATNIFSPSIVAVGNVQEADEITQLCDMANYGITYYLDNLALTNNSTNNVTNAHNFYCDNQKLNPHTAKVMINLGLNEADVTEFIHKCLFPAIKA